MPDITIKSNGSPRGTFVYDRYGQPIKVMSVDIHIGVDGARATIVIPDFDLDVENINIKRRSEAHGKK